MRAIALCCLVLALTGAAQAARLKDIAFLRGQRSNQLLGYGIVVGLAGTGDTSFEVTQSTLAMALKGMGVEVKAPKVESKNAAAVVVSANLPAFAKNGSRLDVVVSSLGNAPSLEGGTLIMTALRGPDGKVYAMAQGKLVTLRKADPSGRQLLASPLTNADIPEGALVEREVPLDFAAQRELRYQLRHPDFTTAARVSRRINEELGGKYATATDGSSIDLILPYNYDGNPVDLVAQLEGLDVEADSSAKVIVNPRTGTVILGEKVRVNPVAIAHKSLRLEVRDANRTPSSDGKPAGPRNVTLLKGASIGDVVEGLNEMGVSGDDLVAIIQSLKASGALMAEVEVQ